MAKAFSVISWNVEHFGAKGTSRKPAKPIPPIVDYLASHNAYVIAVYK